MKTPLKFNKDGFSHVLGLMAVVVIVAVVGTYFLVSGNAAVTYYVHTTADETVASLVNNERSSRGIAKLSRGSVVDDCAVKWAKRMAATQTLAHNPNLKECITTSYKLIGENVGYGPSVSSVHKAFMNSAGHKANILNKAYNRLGVGVAVDSNGRYWVCQVFRDPV